MSTRCQATTTVPGGHACQEGLVRCEKEGPHNRHENTRHCPPGHGWTDRPPSDAGEFAVVIRRGPKCLQPDTKSLLPQTIFDSRDEAEKACAWYRQALACSFPKYARHCRYVVVELTEVQS
ncbi:hypothetical protein [Nocardia sp. NPDC057227]|uniref:hypothetical protein n=1 Tax=Nocardia sp. NPDC057227 TaxID=3346056 RepID=UPI0036445419